MPSERLDEDDEQAIARHISQPRDELSNKTVREMVRHLVEEELSRLGVDEPKEFARNMDWVSQRRSLEGSFTREGLKALVTALVLGFVAAIGFYLRGGKQ